MTSYTLEISESQSKEICDLVNSSKSAYAYALALDHVRSTKGSSKNKVTFAKMVDIKLEAYTLSYVECSSGSMCMINSSEIQFDPPLQSVSDVYPRLHKESQKAMAAKFSWLLTEPLPLLILLIMIIFGYITIILKQDGLRSTMDGIPLASKFIISIFGSVDGFYTAVLASFYFSIFAHVSEAVYVTYKLKTKFNLPGAIVTGWLVLVSCVGYPITCKALDFIRIDYEQTSKKRS